MTVLEGCHSSILGPQPRGRTTISWQQAGWRNEVLPDGTCTRLPVMREVVTHWNERKCGIQPQQGFDDPGCRGCENYPEKNDG